MKFLQDSCDWSKFLCSTCGDTATHRRKRWHHFGGNGVLWHSKNKKTLVAPAGGKIKTYLRNHSFLFLLWVLSGKAELFGGFERVIWMWDIKKNREVFMYLHGEILLLLLWVSYHGCSKGKESDCFLETDFLFTVKELRNGNFHLSISYHQKEECDNMQSFVRVSVIISRQPVRDQWIVLNY